MFSNTTIELSTSMPAANVMPAKLMTFRFRPSSHSMMNVPMMLIGIATPITNVLLPVRRKRNRTITARILPMTKFCRTSESELLT